MAELNGRPVTIDELLPLALLNYGTFTSMRVEADRTVRGLGLHLERLETDCHAAFGANLDISLVRGWLSQAIRSQPAEPRSLRATLYDPGLQLGSIGAPATPHVLITTSPARKVPTSPLRIGLYQFERDMARVKHTGLWSQLHRRREAQLRGYDDAAFIERDGRISEGTTWNLGFIHKDGRVIWPDAAVLPGTTMRLLQQVHPFETQIVRFSELDDMAGAFATNVSIGVRTIATIDDHPFPVTHPQLARLKDAWSNLPCEAI
ncbi:MAG: aminotransferase class IV [Phycicoccus sp.]